ncbi:hypothetical protein FQR65_LT16177 [Abscondita terminalis]|nr:hypothetical protein FQR65_LT16177 [Abscondita terminalis]
MDNINAIVNQVLQSPELRRNLESTIRSLGNIQDQRSTVTQIPSSSSIRDEIHRIFPSIRRNTSDQTSLTRTSKRKRSTYCFFHKDVILLQNPSQINTLRGIQKSHTYENGFGFSNVQFDTTWKYTDIIENISNLFKDVLEGKQFELMLPIGGRLIKPNLPPGQDLCGNSLKSLFAQKIIYVRPFEIIGSYSLKEIDHDNGNDDPEDDPEFLEEVQASSVETITGEGQEKTLEEILFNLKNKINEESITQFNIYREDIFNCCVRAVQRKTFKPFNKISVMFSDIEGNSEGAVDIGGPTREMFRLLLEYIKNSRLFFGNEKKYITLNREALEKNHYFEAGRFIALSLIHGGPGAHFFSTSFFSVLTLGFLETNSTIDDVEDEIKTEILKLNEIDSLNTLREFIFDEKIFSIAGCQWIESIEEKPKLLQDILHFYACQAKKEAIEQFQNGLSTGNILEYMKQSPDLFKDIMCGSKVLITASILQNLFIIEYSEIGSSKRIIENRTISFWRDFLIDCEEGDSVITLSEILIFATGADEIPMLGFDINPKILFLHNDKLYPEANTCALQIQLPTSHLDYSKFKNNISFGISNSKCFAFA